MPDRPTWSGQLEEVSAALRDLPERWIDRQILERALRIGRRRAQQILAPCVTRRVGASGLADRESVIAHLGRLVEGETAEHEQRRRRRFLKQLEKLREDRKRAVLVSAPAAIVQQELARLPQGVVIAPGEITIRFRGATEALEKLLALAMAIGNDELSFERLATGRK